MTGEERKKEIEEAVRAGERALQSLRTAEERLASAGRWGIADMLGGGLFVSFIKHGRIDEASSYLETAKADLRIFQRELRDIPDQEGLTVDIGGFLSFADIFFDNFLADYMVQTKIDRTREKVQEMIRRVEMLLARIRSGVR